MSKIRLSGEWRLVLFSVLFALAAVVCGVSIGVWLCGVEHDEIEGRLTAPMEQL